MNKPIALFTNDVEHTSIVNGRLTEAAGKLVSIQGMPRLLDLYDKYNVKSVFFYTGNIAKSHPEVIRAAQNRGHEIACHGLSHEVDQAFDVLPLKVQIEHLREAKKIIEDIAGIRIVSFRAPALRVNGDTVKALHETGFEIDSSVASQRFDMFFSHGNIKKLKWLSSPRGAYRTSPDSLYKKGEGPLIEVPVSALWLPYIGTTLRVFPGPTKIVRKLLIWESKAFNHPINFLTHPNEFIDEKSEKKNKIERRGGNIISYFLGDYLRTKLKTKNLGLNGLALLEHELKMLQNSGFEFPTLQDFVNNKYNN